MHTGFEFWLGGRGETARTGEVAASLERANEAAIPTVRLTGVDAAYWCATPEKNHLRWVMPHPEEQLLDALARLHAAGASSLGEGTRLVGSFRAHGLIVPVWDLPVAMRADEIEKPAAAFGERLGEALAVRRAADRRGAQGAQRTGEPSGHAELRHAASAQGVRTGRGADPFARRGRRGVVRAAAG